MRLQTFTVKGLHGLLDLEIQFLNDLTVIVGRNGAGKTSALNLISDMLRINKKGLISTDFVRAELTLHGKGGTVKLIASKEVDEHFLKIEAPDQDLAAISLTANDSGVWTQLLKTVDFDSSVKSLTIKPPARIAWNFDELKDIDLLGKKSEKYLREQVHLTFVRLDRTILASDTKDSIAMDEGDIIKAARERLGDRKIIDPIDVVREVTKKKYLDFKSTQGTIRSDAIEKLLRLHFVESDAAFQYVPHAPRTYDQLAKQISDLEQRVSTSALVQGTPGLAGPVEKFFEETRRLLSLSSKQDETIGENRLNAKMELESLLYARQARIQKLLEIFKEEQHLTAEAYSQLKTYLEVIQEFFQDSGKEICFDPKTFDLSFRMDSRNSKLDSPHRNISELSSGEKQILIVLTYLAFLTTDRTIFIVDEPELSLHLRWQGNLINALTRLRSQNCQIILATHAPEIAGKVRENCYVLTPIHLQA